MFKHLKYIDGNSDKFWEIETSGSSHTVTYGRNGTDGQSKTKSFDSEDACLKDAEKLINEKTKKGYSEDGSVNPIKKLNKDAKPVERSASQQQKEELIEEFNNIIKRANVDAVLPFLEKYSNGNLEILRKELRAAKKYYMSFIDLAHEPQFRHHNPGNWGTRGNRIQQFTIKLLALGIINQSEANSWSELVSLFNELGNPKLMQILDYSKPTWLGEFLLQQISQNNWVEVKYWNLRKLEEKGYLKFIPELYAVSIQDFYDGYVNNMDLGDIDKLLSDKIAVERDLPLLFEYETNIQNLNYSYDFKTKTSISLWKKVFLKLIDEGKLSKEEFMTKSLEIQTKNWNNSLKSFYREIISELNPDSELLIKEQHAIFSLFHSDQTAPINFAINLLKPIIDHKEFEMQEFLSWIEPVFMRVDLKGGIKTLIIQLDKLLKNKPELRDQISEIIADTFMIPDLQIQERAAKFLLKHQKKVASSVQEKLSMYKEQMLGAIPQDLKDLLGTEQPSYSEAEIIATLSGDENVVYKYDPLEVEKLVDEVKVPSNWNDILFQLGQFIHSKDYLDMEIFLNAWTLNLKDFPQDYKKKIEPYINKLKNSSVESAFIEIFSAIFINYFHSPSKNYTYNNTYYAKSKTVLLLNHLMVILQNRWRSGIQLPLLSLPTHKPYWIDPSVLLDRILLHEKMQEEINLLDLSIALSRTVRENLMQVESKIEKVSNEQLKGILRFALGFDPQINLLKKNWFSKLIENSDTEDDWLGVWATVARSHNPDDVFEVFDSTNLKMAPFAVRPYEMEFKVKPYFVDSMNWQTNKRDDLFVGNQLQYDFPSNKKYPETFLYALDIFNRGKDRYFSYYLYAMDIAYVTSITPQNTEAICLFYTIQHNGMAMWSGKASKPLLEQMLYPFFKMNEYATWFLVTSLYNKEKEVRATAVELLIQLIEQNRLPTQSMGPKISMLINNDFGPIGRMTEIFEQCKDISQKHNQALLQVLAATFEGIEIKDKMPTNFKKLIELFYDLQHKTNWHLSENLITALKNLEAYKSIQPILKKILK